MTDTTARSSDVGAQVLTFVIADVRGYTRFTRERGDAAAAELARRFAEIAREAVEARGGSVIELRGDEALAVFASTRQAVRAAIDLQLACAEDTEADPAFPFLVGVGVDVGPAVPVEDGYRGVALNLSARLCSAAGAGQVFLSARALQAVGEPPPGVVVHPREPMSFKGFDEPIEVVEAVPTLRPAPRPHEPRTAADSTPLAGEGVLVGRVGELRWLRGTWRQVRRGSGRVIVLGGRAGIGKTRLAAELAEHVAATAGRVQWVPGGGTAPAEARRAIRAAVTTDVPTLLVVDDADAVADVLADALPDVWSELEQRPVLVLVIARAPQDTALAPVRERADADGDGERTLMPLTGDEIRAVVSLYAGASIAEAPVESIARSSRGVPGRIHELASDWARSEATRRLEAAAEYIAAVREQRTNDLDFADNVIGLRLGQLFANDFRPGSAGGLDIPYKGLAPFDGNDAAWFFGRERLVGELAARLVATGLLAVVGASGSGKSSVIAAGLVPSLEAGLLPGSDRWVARTMRPGVRPLQALSDALGVSSADPFAAAIAEVPPDGRLVLVIDQFEELFTLCASDDERVAFLDLLARAATSSAKRFVAVLALRSDFYGHVAAHAPTAELLRDNHVLVGPLTRDELQRVVTLPARRAGVHVEAALAEALVAEAADEPGALPLLSTALVELWQAREDGWLRLASYRESGGIRGAVARLAEASYGELDPAEQGAARRVMLRLAAGGEGDAVTRRRVAIDEFDLAHDDAARRVIERFTQDRLLTSEENSVEVAHEALLREWPRLAQWLREDAQGHEVRRHLVRAARTWHSGGRESSELYRGARLSIALDWAAEHSTDLNESERAFLAASREAAESDAEEQRRANRRLRVLLTGAVVLLVVAVAAGAIAVVQRGSARRSATRASAAATAALAQKLGAQAIAQPRIDVAMLLAREAIALDPTVQTRDELLTTLLRVPSAVRTYHWNSDRNGDLRLTPDGRTLAIADNNGNWIWRDTASGRELRRNRDALLAFAPDGSAIDGARGQPLVVREPGTYAVARSIDAPPFTRSWDPGVVGFADGGHTAVVTFTRNVDTGTGPQAQQARVLRVDLDTGRWGRPVVLDKANKGLALLPGGRLALVDDPTTTVVVDTVTGRTTRRYAVTGGFVAVSPNGRTAALPRDDGAMQFLDLRSGQVQVGIDRSQAARMVFTPDGGTLVVGGEDGTVQVWSVGDHKVTKTFAGHAGPVHALAMSPDGTTVYSGSFDTDVVAWDLTGTRGVAQTYSGGDADPALDAWTLAIAPDGHTAAEAGAHGDVVLSDLVTHRQVARFSTGNGVVSATTYSPDGRELLVSKDPIQPSPNPKTWLQIWALAPQPHIVRTFDTSGWKFLTWSTWSRDGSTVAATGLLRGQTFDTGGAVAEWDARTGRPLGAPLLVKGGYPVVVAFAPHGRVVGVGGYAISSIVADPSRGKVLATMRGSNERFSYQEGIAFSPDGTQLATAQWDGTIRLWDSRTGRQLVKIQDSAQGVVEGVAWSPDGKTLAATDWTPSLHLYDVSSHQQLGSSIPLPVLPAPLNYSPWVQFTPDGSKVVVNGTNDETVVVPITLSALANEACRVAGRSFTRGEWAQYVPARPYQPVCPAS